jgi:uncharacterized protein YoxC
MINAVVVTASIAVAAFLKIPPIMIAAVAAVFAIISGVLAKRQIDPLVSELAETTGKMNVLKDKMQSQTKDMEKNQAFLKQIASSQVVTALKDIEQGVRHSTVISEQLRALVTKGGNSSGNNFTAVVAA